MLNRENDNQKKSLATLAGIMAFVVFFILALKYSRIFFESRNIQTAIIEMNAKLPQQVDPISILDSLTLQTDKYIVYHYTVDVDEAFYEQFDENLLRTTLLQTVMLDELKKFRDREFTFEYRYSKKGEGIFSSIVITPEMYSN